MAECENAYESCAVECVNLALLLTVDLLFLQENFVKYLYKLFTDLYYFIKKREI